MFSGGQTDILPIHVAIIMDGNGRWARQKRKPRPEGHRKGIEAARMVIEECRDRGIRYLTLFAFSSENWRRPSNEISMLIDLFAETLSRFGEDFQKHDVRVRFLGELGVFPKRLQKAMFEVQESTEKNRSLSLGIAVNYGGRWDVVNAVRSLAAEGADLTGISPERLSARLSTAYAPDPDLLIRTGGDLRISNFMLWQFAYTELYFTPTFWPDFAAPDLEKAFREFAARERRFGAVLDAGVG